MGYHIVDPNEIKPMKGRSATTRSISDAVDLENIGLRMYDAEPGEQIPLNYHYHNQQEEVFYVLKGELHVETPEEEYIVGAGECFIVEPESPHRAFNQAGSEDHLRLLALGAPSVDDAYKYNPET